MKCPIGRNTSEPCPRKVHTCEDCNFELEERAALIAVGENVSQTKAWEIAKRQARDAMPGQKVLL
jgi:hypothetical protein